MLVDLDIDASEKEIYNLCFHKNTIFTETQRTCAIELHRANGN